MRHNYFLLQANLAGYMHFWGLTIDTVTTIIIVLAIGLTVDYSAHLGHAFMISKKGNRNGIFIFFYIVLCTGVFFIYFITF